MKVVYSVAAWYAIGFDDGKFRIRGGRAIYEAVMYDASRNGKNVKLARLEFDEGAYEVSRYVPPDTMLEFLAEDDEAEKQLMDYYGENWTQDKFVLTKQN